MKKISFAALLVFVIVLVLISTVQAQSPQQILNQYISDLQKNPNDYGVREKIVKYVQTMKPAPAILEEARRHFIEGNVLLKAAQDQKGYGLAVEAYRQCLLIAPWWAEAYYSYSIALEQVNQFDEAMNALKLYIAANPGEGESRKAQDKIYEMGAKKKLAAQEKEEAPSRTPAAQEQDKFEDLLKKINGRRYTMPGNPGYTGVIDVRGRILVKGIIGGRGTGSGQGYHEVGGPDGRVQIRGRETTIPIREHAPFQTVWAVASTYIISEDGVSITNRAQFNDGDVREYIFFWQR